jgi:hypothetical protein
MTWRCGKRASKSTDLDACQLQPRVQQLPILPQKDALPTQTSAGANQTCRACAGRAAYLDACDLQPREGVQQLPILPHDGLAAQADERRQDIALIDIRAAQRLAVADLCANKS